MKIFYLLLLAMLTTTANAAKVDYKTLWKQVDDAASKDQPRTEIKNLDQIIKKANREKSYGNLLAAEVAKTSACYNISPDSLNPAMDRLKVNAWKAADATLKAVYYAAVAKAYQSVDNADSAKVYFSRALSNPSVLANAKATDYRPLVVKGDEGRVFGDDLLHVVAIEAKEYKLMSDYYGNHGNSEAALTAAVMGVDNDPSLNDEARMAKFDSLATAYKGNPQSWFIAFSALDYCETRSTSERVAFVDKSLSDFPISQYPRMAKLQNYRNSLTAPRFNVALGSNVWIPTSSQTVKLSNIVNITEINIEITRLKADGTLNPERLNTKQLLALSTGNPVFSISRSYTPANDYSEFSDSISVPQLPIGVYLIKVYSPTQKATAVYQTVFVSNVKLLYTTLDKSGRMRLAVVDATTGKPISNAKITLTENYNNQKKSVKSVVATGKDGEAQYNNNLSNYRAVDAFVVSGDDKYLPHNQIYKNFYFNRINSSTRIRILTDRSVYRPGQRLQAAIMVWEEDSLHAHAVAGREETLTLRDANYKVVAEKTVTTNSLGTASASFDIPTEGLTGSFTISSQKLGGATTIKVEEYKRPTFRIEFEEYKNSYAIGDTVRIKGKALSYSGVPVQNAKVEYTVSRSQAWWWRRRNGGSEQLLTSTATTNSDGEFTVRLPMTLPSSANPGDRHFYNITAKAKVTNLSGESHEEEASLPLGTRPTMLTVDLPEKSLADSLRHITFTRVNMAGKEIVGTVSYTIDGKAYTAKANSRANMAKLPSGSHNLVAICGSDTLRQKFVVFTLADKRPAVETEDWFFASGETVGKDSPVYVQVGSSKADQHIFYTLYNGENLLESGSLNVSNSIKTRKFTDKYSGNLLLNYVWVRNGRVYSHSCTIKKQLPSNKLKLKWTTFRDRLTPGQKEKWTLNVLQPDGKPARALLISTLYDKSLDLLYSHNWDFSITPSLPTAMAQWRTGYTYEPTTGYYVNPKYANVPPINYWAFNEKYFEFYALPRFRGGRVMLMAKSEAIGSLSESKVAVRNDVAKKAAPVALDDVAADTNGSSESENVKANNTLRTNLQETAFFIPDALTDSNGNITLSFTLPESVTTWRYMGLAHDSLMNYGSLVADVIAQKQIMVQPNVPRFIRQGDRASIGSVVSNTTSKDVNATVTLKLTDAATDRVVLEQSQQCTVKANGTSAVNFTFDSNAYPDMLVCDITATSDDFADGEQHYLPVLSPFERVIDTHPFTINGSGTKTIDLGRLKGKKPKLTLEYTANPSLLVLGSLHSVANPDSKNAISLATSIYANRLGQFILNQNPKMKQYAELWVREEKQTSMKSNLQKNEDLKDFSLGETPWVQDAENEESQKRAVVYFYDDNTVSSRLNSVMNELKKLQNQDGSFSWWPGMDGNVYMTLAVNRTLVRLQKLTGDKSADATELIDSSFGFLDKKIAEEVAELKRLQKKFGRKNLCPSEFACDYLYASALYGRKPSADMNYLVDLLSKMPTRLTIYGKANSAIILAYFNQKQRAADYLKSMKEYTVYNPETGRYFDTPKASYSWFDYRIPTQTAAIEAMKLLAPADTTSITEMQYWLLQEKRTTQWSTPINTANAVYAFLDGGKNVFNASGTVTLSIDGSNVSLPKSAAGTGYFRMDLPADASKVAISKSGTGTSWGALYAQYTDRSTDIKKASNGISITRKVEGANHAKVGDKVKVVITIKADRDYDFVEIADRRAACLEPANQLSGYNGHCYEETRDKQTNYFFDRLPKGTWQVATEYFIDREGDYQSGTATVGCAYAPEYSGRDVATIINVNK